MKKRLLSLLLVLILVLSINTVIFAGPGGGVEGEPVMIYLPIDFPIDCPIECPEDCQGEDDDNQD